MQSAVFVRVLVSRGLHVGPVFMTIDHFSPRSAHLTGFHGPRTSETAQVSGVRIRYYAAEFFFEPRFRVLARAAQAPDLAPTHFCLTPAQPSTAPPTLSPYFLLTVRGVTANNAYIGADTHTRRGQRVSSPVPPQRTARGRGV